MLKVFITIRLGDGMLYALNDPKKNALSMAFAVFLGWVIYKMWAPKKVLETKEVEQPKKSKDRFVQYRMVWDR